LRKFGFKGRIVVIPNGFDPSSVPEFPPQSNVASLLLGRPKFLSVGRLDMHHKGLDLLIHAFAEALRSGVLPASASLTFVGPDGGDLKKLERLVSSRQLSTNVSFAGRVPIDVRWRMVQSCDVLLLCSRYDGFGLVALEGMLAGKPLLVSKEAGVAEWVQRANCGVLVAPGVSSIKAGFAELMKFHGGWETAGDQGRSFAYKNLTWDHIGYYAAECYREIEGLYSHAPEPAADQHAFR
jgi:glycosyltransferase involved in cell wall biosynthesis